MKRNSLIFITFLFTILDFSTVAFCFTKNNVSQHLKYVGNPYSAHRKYKEHIYARNTWDMIAFHDKLYLGAGNSSNIGPSPNSGPVPIISYTPATNSFETVFTTSEEQIDVFYIFDNKLYIPGHDPREGWELGNLYLSEDGRQWQKKRTVPKAIHTYCLHSFNGKLFAGVGTSKGAAVAVSKDYGNNWDLSVFNRVGRFYDFLEVNGRLYVVGTIMDHEYRQSLEQQGGWPIDEVFEYSDHGKFIPRRDLGSRQLFPGTLLNKNEIYKITKTQRVASNSIYLGAVIHNDHQFRPIGLYVAESSPQGLSVRKVALPDKVVPWDIYLAGEYVYVLANRNIIDDRVETTVWRSNNLEDWEELFYFASSVFVRSFALLEDTFYFSLGSEIANSAFWQSNELKAETGDILKLDTRSFLHTGIDSNTNINTPVN